MQQKRRRVRPAQSGPDWRRFSNDGFLILFNALKGRSSTKNKTFSLTK
jgi:hypothetical protein